MWSEQVCAPADGPVGTAASIDEPVLDQQGRLRLLVGGGGGRRAGSEHQHRTMAAQAAAAAAAEAAGPRHEGQQ